MLFREVREGSLIWDVLQVSAPHRSPVMNALIRLYVLSPDGFVVFGETSVRGGDVRLYLSPKAARMCRKVTFLKSRFTGRIRGLPEGCSPLLGEPVTGS